MEAIEMIRSRQFRVVQLIRKKDWDELGVVEPKLSRSDMAQIADVTEE